MPDSDHKFLLYETLDEGSAGHRQRRQLVGEACAMICRKALVAGSLRHDAPDTFPPILQGG